MPRIGVVGAGAAGCLVARRLADAGHDVVLFEAGRRLHPTLDFAALLDDSTAFWPTGQPSGYRRPRALGGGSAVNAMLASAPDSFDLDSFDQAARAESGTARFALARVVADMAPQLMTPGPVGRALGDAAVAAGHRIGGSTLDVDATGVLAAALSARSGERRDSVLVYLDDAPDSLEVRTGVEVGAITDSGRQPTVEGLALDPVAFDPVAFDPVAFDPVAFDHVVCSAGALASPRLLKSVLAPGLRPLTGVNHRAIPITIALDPDRRSTTSVPAVSRVVRWASEIGDGRIDAQIVAVDHMGWSADGRALGLLIVTLLAVDDLDEQRRRAVVDHAQQLLASESLGSLGPVVVDGAAAPNPVHHMTGTLPLGSHTGPAGLLLGSSRISVIDGSVLPYSPRADTHIPVLTMAQMLTEQLLDHLS